MPNILIVEDEAAIADTLIFALQGEGFTTTWLSLGQEALAHQRQAPADLIILDIGLPDITGFETCKQLRRFSEVPVMFLSARDGEIDRVVGLEIGADDYVVKPFSPREVAARVKAILKRVGPGVAPAVFQVDLEHRRRHTGGPAPRPTPHQFPPPHSPPAHPAPPVRPPPLPDAGGGGGGAPRGRRNAAPSHR
ncbi:response regulator, partial [Pseudomonas sp. Marseille-Q1929]|uniref:response regulator n=1 Tax=Pseudomonas sp. Marseille-Q1929 TaxID=2730402 RepID=UPI001F5C9708